MAPPLRLHSRVFVSKIGTGEVLFVGQTAFAPSVWVGVALDPGVTGGKNDGSVQGKRYFDVEPGMGVFVRPSQVEVIEDEPEDEEEQDGEPSEEAAADYNAPASPASVASSAAAPHGRSSVAAMRPPLAAGRSGIAPPTPRGASPDKTSLRPLSRPSIVSRESATSSISAASSPSSARRSIASSPSKSTPISRASPAKPPSGRLPGPALSARTSTAGQRLPAVTSRTASPAVATPRPSGTRLTAPGTIGRASTVGGASKATSTVGGASRVGSGGRTAATTQDSQSAAARAGLRTVGKARPSMAAATPAASRSLVGSRRQSVQDEASPKHSPQLQDEDEDDSGPSAVLSPSSQARDRLEASRRRSSATTSATMEEGTVLGSSTQTVDTAQDPSVQPYPSSISSMEHSALKREVEELRVKTRLAEKRREEDKTRVKELENWKEETSEKLRMAESSVEKAQSMSSQLLNLQISEKELAIVKAELEQRIEELMEQTEMAALDREVAEEKAEAVLAELENLKQTNEELTLEVEVLREENAAFEQGPVDESEKSSVGWIQLEKQNERLKEALMRLRDITAETESEQRRKISELEREVSSLADLQDSRDALAAKLEASEAQLEDVKTQLDDALGAEEMLEQLTERNLFLGERINEMTATIEELESLKELNEELEEMHLETEKQLQEEIDIKEMALRERTNRVERLEENAAEYEGTFSQFRELVLNLQGDVEALRTERDGLVQDGQNAQLNSQSREMLNLNLKLQSSTMKSQARSIDVEISRIKAEEAAMQLEMTRPYLPPAFKSEGDADAVQGLLFFQRMSSKADLIKTTLEATHPDGSQLLGTLSEEGSQPVPDGLVTMCQLRHSLAHFSAVCNSTAAMLKLSPPDAFLKSGRMYKEMQAAMEGRVDGHVEALRREELKEADCGADFKRFVRQFEELSFSLATAQEEAIQQMQAAAAEGSMNSDIPSGDGDLAAKEVGSATLLDLDLDTLSAALSSARHSLASVCSTSSGKEDEEGEQEFEWQLQGQTLQEVYFGPLVQLLSDIKSTKMLARKLLRRLSSLASNDEAVSMDAIGELPSLGRLSSKLVAFAIALDSDVSAYLQELRTSKSPFVLDKMVDIINSASRELRSADEGDDASSRMSASSTVSSGSGPWQVALSSARHLATTISSLVAAATEQSNVAKISGLPPWLPRSAVVQAIASRNVEAESQLLKLQDDLRNLYQQIKARDAALQEGAIKLERLQRQVDRSKAVGEAHEAVKVQLAEVKRQSKTYQDANESLQAELEALEKKSGQLQSQVASLKENADKRGSKETDVAAAAAAAAAAATRGAGDAGRSGSAALFPAWSTAPAAHLETNYLIDQLDAMRGSLRYLREENALLQGTDLARQVESLPPLVHALGGSDPAVGHAEREEEELYSSIAGMPRKKRLVGAVTAADLRSVESEKRHLYASLLQVGASPRLVVLPKVQREASVKGVDVVEATKPATTTTTTTTTTAATSTAVPTETSRRTTSTPTVSKRIWHPIATEPWYQYSVQQSRYSALSTRFDKLRSRSGINPTAAGVGGGSGGVAHQSNRFFKAREMKLPVLMAL